jgi:hypothetical protein
MKQLSVVGVILSFFLMACSNNDEVESKVDSNGNFWIKYQTVERVTDGNLFVELVDVEDLRCPVGEVCAEHGFVTVEIKVSMGDQQSLLVLQTGKFQDQLNCTKTVFGHKIELVDVSPYPYTCVGTLSDKRGYVVVLKVE